MPKTTLLCYGALTLCLLTAGVPTAHAAKRVVVDKSSQTLRAYENGHLVFQTRVSTGKSGKTTPNGTFRARMKKPMHYSSRYNNAPMPYSVQYNGNYFIHGYSHVPSYPASSGCVRLPLNTAPAFYRWVTPGTPITITGTWNGPRQRQATRKRSTARKSTPQRQQRYPRQVAESPTYRYR